MRIRCANSEDAAAIAAVVHAMRELSAIARQPVAKTEKAVSENLARAQASGQSAVYVAENDAGAVVGYGAVHWTPFLFLAGGEAYVTELFVHPSAAGRGIGTAILEEITAEAGRRGCARVSLLNGRDRESYRRSFYKQRGWIERENMANFVLPLAK